VQSPDIVLVGLGRRALQQRVQDRLAHVGAWGRRYGHNF
jgi:hypothetical protein